LNTTGSPKSKARKKRDARNRRKKGEWKELTWRADTNSKKYRGNGLICIKKKKRS